MEDPVYQQILESLESVVKMTARLDERVRVLTNQQNVFDTRITELMAILQSISSRIYKLEARDNRRTESEIDDNGKRLVIIDKQVQILAHNTTENSDRWKGVVGTLLQVVTATLIGFLLYKLGLPH